MSEEPKEQRPTEEQGGKTENWKIFIFKDAVDDIQKTASRKKRKANSVDRSSSRTGSCSDFDPTDGCSTPKLQKRDSLLNLSQLNFKSPNTKVSDHLIRTKASQDSATFSFQGEFLKTLEPTTNVDRDEDGNSPLHTSIDLGVVKISPSTSLRDKLSDRSLTESEKPDLGLVKVSPARSSVEKLSDRSMTENDKETVKKCAKKKLGRQRDNTASEGYTSSDYSINQELNQTDLRRLCQDQNTTHKNKKLERSFEQILAEENPTSSTRVSEAAENVKHKHKKKKKKEKRADRDEDFLSDSTLNDALVGVDRNGALPALDYITHRKKKLKRSFQESLAEETATSTPEAAENGNPKQKKRKKKRAGGAEDFLADSTLNDILVTNTEKKLERSFQEILDENNATNRPQVGQVAENVKLKQKKKKKKRVDGSEDFFSDSTLNDNLGVDRTGDLPIDADDKHSNSQKKTKEIDIEDLLTYSALNMRLGRSVSQTSESSVQDPTSDNLSKRKKKGKRDGLQSTQGFLKSFTDYLEKSGSQTNETFSETQKTDESKKKSKGKLGLGGQLGENLSQYSAFREDLERDIEHSAEVSTQQQSQDVDASTAKKKKKKEKIVAVSSAEDLLDDSILNKSVDVEPSQELRADDAEGPVSSKMTNKKQRAASEDLLSDSTPEKEPTKKMKINESQIEDGDLLENAPFREDLERAVESTQEQSKDVDASTATKKKKSKKKEFFADVVSSAEDLFTDSTLNESLKLDGPSQDVCSDHASCVTPKKKNKKKTVVSKEFVTDSWDDEEPTKKTNFEEPRSEDFDTPVVSKKMNKEQPTGSEDVLSDGCWDTTSDKEPPRKFNESQIGDETAGEEDAKEEGSRRKSRRIKKKVPVSDEESCTIEHVTNDKRRKSTKTPVKPNKLKKLFLEHSFDDIEKKVRYSTKVEKCEDDEEELARADLLEALEEANKKNSLKMEETKALQGLHVLLPWSVPPLHLLQTRISKNLTEQQQEQLNGLAVPIKSGKFSKAEDEKITKNWQTFCKIHNLPTDPAPFLFFRKSDTQDLILSSSERMNFVRFLAHGLEDRLVHTVFHRFRRLFTPETVSGRFTAKEDKRIIAFLRTTDSATPYSDLAKILNRDRSALEKRARVLGQHARGEKEVVKWTTERMAEFLRELVDLLELDNVDELKDREITRKEWKEMSERMNQPTEKLHRVWFTTIYPRIFLREKFVDTSEIKRDLVALLIKRGEDDWRTLDWNDIAKEMGQEYGCLTGAKLLKMFNHSVEYFVPASDRKNLKACLNCLKQEKFRRRKMKRLKILDNRANATDADQSVASTPNSDIE